MSSPLEAPESVKNVTVDPAAARETGYPAGHEYASTTTTSKTTKTSAGTSKSSKKGPSDEEKKSILIKVAAAAAAVVAIGLAVYKAKNKSDEEKPHSGHYEEKFDKTKHDVKHQAESKTDDFKHQAEKAKHKVAEIIPQPVKDTADKVSDKASQVKEKIGHASQDFEKKGLKASERSDHNVHKVYDKSADALSNLKGDAKGKAHEAKDSAKDAGHKAEHKADKAANKADQKGCTIM